MMIAWLNRKLKKTDIWDVGLIKWSSIAFVFVGNNNLASCNDLGAFCKSLVFFIVFVILAARPFYRFYLK